MRYPIIYANEEKTMLLLDTLFATEEYLQYAIKHNMDVKLTDTTSTSSVEHIYKFVKEGFNVSFDGERVFTPDGIEINPRTVVYLTRNL